MDKGQTTKDPSCLRRNASKVCQKSASVAELRHVSQAGVVLTGLVAGVAKVSRAGKVSRGPPADFDSTRLTIRRSTL